MAIMIPSEIDKTAFNESLGEERVYDSLKNLPDDYYVFHSVHWNRKKISGRVRWGESDFVIFNPSRGILVLEVKSGGISCHDGIWMQKNLRTGEAKNLKRSPLEQASESKYVFLEQLDDLQSTYAQKLVIEPIVWFPSVDDKSFYDKLPNNLSNMNAFIQQDLENPEKAIERAFSFYNMEHLSNYKKEDIAKVLNIFASDFDAVQSLAGRADDQNYIFNKMTREQSSLINYLDEQRVVAIQGAGGTGKTMIALEKARRLSADGKVLFLCFNRMLLDHLRSAFSSTSNNIDFHNLYTLCNQKTISDKIDENTLLDFLNSRNADNWDYKHIIVDEGQDFSNDQLDYLNILADEKEGCFYVFYDKNQLVQRFDENDWFNNVDCRLVLSKNCRNTSEIAATSYSTLGDKPKASGISSLTSGDKPIINICDNKDEILNRLVGKINEYKENGFTNKQIVILTVKTEQDSVLNGIHKLGKYSIGSDLDADILFTTARKYKGLESDVVFMIDVNSSTFYSDDNKKLFYVAASRAKNFLEIFADIKDEEMHDIVQYLGAEDRKIARLAFKLALKVNFAKD